MKLKHALVPVAAIAALSLAALPVDAQARQGRGDRGGGRAAPRQIQPRSGGGPSRSSSMPSRGYQGPRGYSDSRAYAQPRSNGGSRGYSDSRGYAQPRSYGGSRGYSDSRGYIQPRAYGDRPGAYAQPRSYSYGQAVPRRGPVPRAYDRGWGSSRGYGYGGSYGSYRGYSGRSPAYYGYGYGYRDYGRRAYAVPRGGYGYSYGYGYGYRYGHGYRPYYYSRPYYVFRPRLSLGFGFWIGFPVTYPYYSYGYANPAYGYPLTTFGLTAGVAYGGISFEVEPYGAAVYVDGEYVGVVEDFEPRAQPLTLRAGSHRVEIQADGYDPMVWDVTVIPGQVVPVRGALQTY